MTVGKIIRRMKIKIVKKKGKERNVAGWGGRRERKIQYM